MFWFFEDADVGLLVGNERSDVAHGKYTVVFVVIAADKDKDRLNLYRKQQPTCIEIYLPGCVEYNVKVGGGIRQVRIVDQPVPHVLSLLVWVIEPQSWWIRNLWQNSY